MEWRLRCAEPADAAAAAMVATASFMAAFHDDLAIGDMIAHCEANCSAAKFAGWLGEGETIVTLAEHPGTGVPVAYSVLTRPDLPVAAGEADVELRRIYLMPVAIGDGLAGRLIARAIADAQALGRRRMLLGVYGGNARAQRFYEKQGFAVIGERKFKVGATWHDDLVFARDL